ncbi:hypothetical protein [Sphingomonas pruni]|uniref:hypothetical protein n=1 Tax=Sphingomonas pruni TaxID=40683 RepID=UPI000AF4276F|nr:hypothetical protein [Sphingomonas pruni]
MSIIRLYGTSSFLSLFLAFLPATAYAQIAVPEFKMVNSEHANILTSADFNLYAPTMDITETVLTIDGSEGQVVFTRYLPKIAPWRNNYKDDLNSSDVSNVWVILDNKLHIFSGMYPSLVINGVSYIGDGKGNGLTVYNDNGIGIWKYVDKDGAVTLFPANTGTSDNYPTSTQYPSGLIRSYYYKTTGAGIRLQSVTQNDGTIVKFVYDTDDASNVASWQHVASVSLINQAYAYCDPTADHCSFPQSDWPTATFSGPSTDVAPSGQTVIETSTTNTGFSRSYKVDSSGRVIGTSNVTPYAEHYTISYVGPYYKVSSISNNKGDTRTFTVNTANPNDTVAAVASNFLGASEYYHFESSGGGEMPTKVIDALGRTTLYQWQFPDNHITKITYPENSAVSYQYDTRFNVISKTTSPKPGMTAASILETANYDTNCVNINTCNKPNFYVDAKGARTDWTYTSYGMKASELDPPATAGGPRRLKLYSYAQKSAYVLNAQGVIVSTGQPIWKLTGETDCQTVAGSNALSCDANGPREDVTYLYGADGTPDNLMLHGKQVSAGGESHLTCYKYDRWRRVISETSPNAQLSVCS